ncbi:MAG: beta-lactamase family protein [Psychrosphaera sp.]|nr:beta-lactamase family protein [Psychrosphaera sp.]
MKRYLALLLLLPLFVAHSKDDAHQGVTEQWQWPQSDAAAVGLDDKPLRRAHSLIRRGKYQLVDSMLVVRHGQLVFEKYYNKGKKHTSHALASAGKSLLSALVGISIGKQQVGSVTDKLHSYFTPYYANYKHWDERKANITLHDLLTMRAGWNCFIGRAKTRCGSLMFNGREPTQAIKWLLDRPMAYKPGEKMLYTDAIPTVLRSVINVAAGDHSKLNYQDDLFKPMGLITKSPFKLTSRQMAMFGQLYLNKGNWHGKQIVPVKWVEKSTSAIYPLRKRWTGQAHSYGYLWWVGTFTNKVSGQDVEGYYAGGNGGQYIVVLPSLDMVVVFTGSNYNNLKTMRQPLAIIEQFILPALDKKSWF